MRVDRAMALSNWLRLHQMDHQIVNIRTEVGDDWVIAVEMPDTDPFVLDDIASALVGEEEE
jgi:hypothetical protein